MQPIMLIKAKNIPMVPCITRRQALKYNPSCMLFGSIFGQFLRQIPLDAPARAMFG
jgi:hypothetical protein